MRGRERWAGCWCCVTIQAAIRSLSGESCWLCIPWRVRNSKYVPPVVRQQTKQSFRQQSRLKTVRSNRSSSQSETAVLGIDVFLHLVTQRARLSLPTSSRELRKRGFDHGLRLKTWRCRAGCDAATEAAIGVPGSSLAPPCGVQYMDPTPTRVIHSSFSILGQPFIIEQVYQIKGRKILTCWPICNVT